MKGKSLYLPFGHAFDGVDSENELQTTTKIHFEFESCGRHLVKMRRRALLTSGKSMARQIVMFTLRGYVWKSTNSTWRSS